MKVSVHDAKPGEALYQRWSITYQLRGDCWYWHYSAVHPIALKPKEKDGHIRIGNLDLKVLRLNDWIIKREGLPFHGTLIGEEQDESNT